jgi:hypothetical protein
MPVVQAKAARTGEGKGIFQCSRANFFASVASCNLISCDRPPPRTLRNRISPGSVSPSKTAGECCDVSTVFFLIRNGI